jgi:multidrug resistance efflux pump
MQQTEMRAIVDGVVTNLNMHPGNYLAARTQAMALVGAASVRIEGYFEKAKLPGSLSAIKRTVNGGQWRNYELC